LRPGLALLLTLATASLRADASPLLHERIADDPSDDVAMKVTLDGDLPAAIETPSGLVSAPDPGRPVDPREAQVSRAAEGQSVISPAAAGVFRPDLDTRRPGLLPYAEPFTPSTAPFKRLAAYDAVSASYELIVADPSPRPLLVSDAPLSAGEDAFFADIVVPRTPGQPFRIPSVGPGARVLHAHLGSGPRDVPFTLWRDGADNWFIRAPEGGRLVMEEAIARSAFGGEVGDPHGADLKAPKLPKNVQTEANRVAAFIGLDRTSVRETLRGLVKYFRSFVDSEESPHGNGSVYLDLALSRKGVCRHRAYAFTITALGLGIPTRMITNEAHAWVEVNDGSAWRRIDLGGAGGELNAPRDASVVGYAAPPDPYAWPPEAERGADLAGRETGAGRGGGPAEGPHSHLNAVAPAAGAEGPTGAGVGAGAGVGGGASARAGASAIHLETVEADVRRGASLQLRGDVEGKTEPCARVAVQVMLRDAVHGARIPIGALATDDKGRFTGFLVLPGTLHLGDYDVVAHTSGGASCGEGWSR
jgi:transglutaminase-like putative cysteine protease